MGVLGRQVPRYLIYDVVEWRKGRGSDLMGIVFLIGGEVRQSSVGLGRVR